MYADIKEKCGENLDFPKNIPITNESKNLLKNLLCFDPSKRSTWK